jgi:hypothetical protein
MTHFTEFPLGMELSVFMGSWDRSIRINSEDDSFEHILRFEVKKNSEILQSLQQYVPRWHEMRQGTTRD